MILGVISSIKDNKGLPDQNLQLLNGKSLLVYTIETALACSMLDDLIVAAADEDVAEISIKHHAKVPFLLSPQIVANSQASKWPALLHIMEKYEKQFGKEINYIADINATTPLKTVSDIDGAIKTALLYPETEVVMTAYSSRQNPYYNMVEIDKKGYAAIVQKEEEPFTRLQDAPQVFNISDAAFVIKKSALYNYSHWSHAICRVYEIPRTSALDMEEVMDYELIKQQLDRR